MSRGRLAIHAHFHQPLRIDPFSGVVPEEPAAAPFHDWNSRIAAECYRPNAERGNLRRISFDLSPTLAGWLAEAEPVAYRGFVGAAPNALAQPYHHTILPLASALDRRTEVRWGIRDFELRFGRRPLGIWLPETAVDLPTLRLVAAEGIRFTILAPWQGTRIDGGDLDTRHPYRVDLDDGRSLIVLFYDGPLSGAVSFDPNATTDAERFAHERVAVRLAGRPGDGGDPVVVVATDAPLDHRNLYRLAKRAGLGLARTGFFSSNGSGDYFLAFSTARTVPHDDGLTEEITRLRNDPMSPLFLATVEATEEAVMAAQRAHGLPVTGRIGWAEMAALRLRQLD